MNFYTGILIGMSLAALFSLIECDSGKPEVLMQDNDVSDKYLSQSDALIIIKEVERENACIKELIKQIGNDVVFPCAVGNSDLSKYNDLKSRIKTTAK